MKTFNLVTLENSGYDNHTTTRELIKLLNKENLFNKNDLEKLLADQETSKDLPKDKFIYAVDKGSVYCGVFRNGSWQILPDIIDRIFPRSGAVLKVANY